jgi:hypothetical protein
MKPNSNNMQITKAPDTASAQRNVNEWKNSGGRTENEADATNVVYHGGLTRLVDLMAESPHVDINEIGLRNESVVPDFFEQHCASENLVLASHHILEQPELAR